MHLRTNYTTPCSTGDENSMWLSKCKSRDTSYRSTLFSNHLNASPIHTRSAEMSNFAGPHVVVGKVRIAPQRYSSISHGQQSREAAGKEKHAKEFSLGRRCGLRPLLINAKHCSIELPYSHKATREHCQISNFSDSEFLVTFLKTSNRSLPAKEAFSEAGKL